jgi:hypothetical protein
MSELIEKLIAAAREYGADASLETANAEMDAQIALFAALGRKDEEYRQLFAEVERLRGIIGKAEWGKSVHTAWDKYQRCAVCGNKQSDGHDVNCPFNGWEGGAQ